MLWGCLSGSVLFVNWCIKHRRLIVGLIIIWAKTPKFYKTGDNSMKSKQECSIEIIFFSLCFLDYKCHVMLAFLGLKWAKICNLKANACWMEFWKSKMWPRLAGVGSSGNPQGTALLASVDCQWSHPQDPFPWFLMDYNHRISSTCFSPFLKVNLKLKFLLFILSNDSTLNLEE